MKVAGLIAVAALLSVASTTSAELVRIDFEGLLLSYDASQGLLFDSNDPSAGSGVPAQSTPLSSIESFVDGNSVGILTSNILADIRLQTPSIPANGGTVVAPFGYFDLLTRSGPVAWGLVLNVYDFSLTYDNVTGKFSGISTRGFIHEQDLPGLGISFDASEPVTVEFVTTIDPSSLVIVNDRVVAFNATGSGSVTGGIGPVLPEPTSILLFGMGGVALLAARRRRKRTNKMHVAA